MGTYHLLTEHQRHPIYALKKAGHVMRLAGPAAYFKIYQSASADIRG